MLRRMTETGSSGSSDPTLREMVDRATGAAVEKHEPARPPRERHTGRDLRILIGLVMFAGGLSGVCYTLVRLFHTGTCASGNTPYVIARQCPSGTGALIGIMVGSIFLALIGGGVMAIGVTFPMGVGFTAMGAAALYAGLTAQGDAAGARSTGYLLGGIFIVMGLVQLAFALWYWLSGRKDTDRPTLTAQGLSQLISATAPRPVYPTPPKLPGNEERKQGD